MATASTFQANVALFLFIFCSSKLVPLFASSTLTTTTTTTTSDSAIPVASPAVGRGGDPSNISSFFPSPSGDQWPSPAAAAAAAPTLSSSGEFTGKKSSSSTRLLVKLDPALNSILLLVLVPLCISFFLF
ncbi:hypothetical protein LINPERPRIM_LOCUS5857 [Linum perenne]